MAESAEEKKDRLPGSNLLSKLLIRKIKKSKANKESKKFKKNEKKNKKQVAKEAKKAVIRTMPGSTKLEKRLNFAGAKARVRKAEREEERGKRKEERAKKRSLRKSNRAVKRATIESMPGNTMLEKRLNFAGAKARARKADREETKKLKKEGPLQQTSRKIEMPSQEVKINQQPRKEIKVLETPLSPEQRSEKEKSKGRSERGKAFDAAFALARDAKGPGKTFMFEGKEYTTNLKEEGNKTTPSSYSTSDAVRKNKQAKHGGALAIMIAPVKGKKMKAVKKGAKAQDGGSLKPVPSDNKGLGKLPKEVRNKMGYMKNGGKVTDPKKKKNGNKRKSILAPEMPIKGRRSTKLPGLETMPFKPGKGKSDEEPLVKPLMKYDKKASLKDLLKNAKYGGAMKKAMYGAKMKKKAMYGAKMKKKY